MKDSLTALVNNLITSLLLLIAVLTPLLFAPLVTEFYEMPKIIFLVSLTIILLILWTFGWVLQGKVLLTRTPLDIPLLLLLGVIILSTFFSSTQYISIFGNFPRVHGSAITWTTYIILYFITTSHLRTLGQIRALFLALVSSSIIVAATTLLSYLGIYPLGQLLPFTKALNFTPAGSSFSSTALMVLLIPLPLLSLITPNKLLPTPLALALAILFSVTAVLVGDLSIWLTLTLVIGLILYLSRNSFNQKNLLFVLLPIGIASILFLLSNLPQGSSANPLFSLRNNFPREIQLPFSTSWKVSASTFRDTPFLGTGPSTYLFNFTQYKPAEYNLTKFWNIRFDVAHNEFLQILATLGGLGFLSLAFLSVMIIAFALKSLNTKDNPFALSLAITGIAAVTLMLFHPTTVVSLTATFLLLAMLMAIHKSISGKVEELSLGIKASKLSDTNLIVGDVLPLIIFLPVVVFAIFASWNMYKVVLADYNHRMAIDSAATRGLDTYNYLVKAEGLNPMVDLYRTDLAQTNFALANAIATQKGPTEASPAGSLTDKDRQDIRQLLSQSINEGRAAVSLSPRNPQNWEILASIYRQVAGVADNALAFSLDAYGRAIQTDPLNPVLRLNVGGIYYAAKNYDLAIRFFSDAANLKPDYANAFYNLSVALRDRGNLNEAQLAAEKVVTLLDPKSADYKAASDYLTDLKARIATGSAQDEKIKPPAAQKQSVLEEDKLPNVLDDELKDKPNSATPAAIPSPTPTP